MLTEVREKLSEQPESIRNILEYFDFAKITMRNNEIRCAFEQGSNPTAIVVRLQNNPACFIKDYERNVSYDLINYIVKEKSIPFKKVLEVVKEELGITDIYNYKQKKGLFGGIYDNISKSNSSIEVKTYPKNVLDNYIMDPNEMFLKDHISLEIQKEFNICYDVITQRICIPVYSAYGDLIGIKARANYQTEEYEPKYLYLLPTAASTTLYGYYQNYDTLYGNDCVIVVEAEKSVLQAATYGYRNVVALASNSLSPTQAKLLIELNTKKVIFALDNSLDLSNTKRNVDVLRTFCKMHELDIEVWDWWLNITCGEKDSPTDNGKKIFEDIITNEIVNADVLFSPNNTIKVDLEEEI